MIRFGTGGWRAIIGDGFTRANIQRVAAALCFAAVDSLAGAAAAPVLRPGVGRLGLGGG